MLLACRSKVRVKADCKVLVAAGDCRCA